MGAFTPIWREENASEIDCRQLIVSNYSDMDYVHSVLKPNVHCTRQIHFLKFRSYFVEAYLAVKMVVREVPCATVCESAALVKGQRCLQPPGWLVKGLQFTNKSQCLQCWPISRKNFFFFFFSPQDPSVIHEIFLTQNVLLTIYSGQIYPCHQGEGQLEVLGQPQPQAPDIFK